MPKDLYRADLNLDFVYPPFLERHLELKSRCRARGASYLTTCLIRTVEDSDRGYALYKAGKGPRFAPGGGSAHNYGLAADEALIIKPAPGRVVRWDLADFKILGEEAAKLGLDWGFRYGDSPHIGWPGFVSGSELQPLFDIWKAHPGLTTMERLVKVWAYVDAHSPTMPEIKP